MASHAIFQYIVLAIDDTHNTWTNMIVKMIILRLLGSSDDREKTGKARPEGPPLQILFLVAGVLLQCSTSIWSNEPNLDPSLKKTEALLQIVFVVVS